MIDAFYIDSLGKIFSKLLCSLKYIRKHTIKLTNY